MLITREIDYAVRCVLEIARRGQTSTAEVAEGHRRQASWRPAAAPKEASP
jgi:DNA-binding IscR family transcriptional regulator